MSCWDDCVHYIQCEEKQEGEGFSATLMKGPASGTPQAQNLSDESENSANPRSHHAQQYVAQHLSPPSTFPAWGAINISQCMEEKAEGHTHLAAQAPLHQRQHHAPVPSCLPSSCSLLLPPPPAVSCPSWPSPDPDVLTPSKSSAQSASITGWGPRIT